MRAATDAGFLETQIMHAVRLEGSNQPGFGSEIAGAIADAGISLRGFSAAAIGKRFVGYLALDHAGDVAKAVRKLRRLS